MDDSAEHFDLTRLGGFCRGAALWTVVSCFVTSQEEHLHIQRKKL